MIQILIIALLSVLAQLVLPWWSIGLVAFLVCFWRGSGAGRSFLYGFVGIALVWLIYSLFIHFGTEGIFTGRMGKLLFQTNNAVMPLLVTTFLGGVVGGISGVTGYYTRQATVNQGAKRTS